MDRRYAVEFIATFIMVFAGCGAIVVETLTGAIVAGFVFVKCKNPSECSI